MLENGVPMFNIIGEPFGNYIQFAIFAQQGYCYIWNIEVNENERGEGKGQRLLDQLVELAIKHRMKAITGKFAPEEPLSARRFFEKNGFSIDASGNMRKELSYEES